MIIKHNSGGLGFVEMSALNERYQFDCRCSSNRIFLFVQEEKESSNDSSTAFIPPTETKNKLEVTPEVCVLISLAMEVVVLWRTLKLK